MSPSRQAGLLAAVLAATLLAYYPALTGGFFNDDIRYIVENNALQNLKAMELWRLAVQPMNQYEFLPLRDLSYWLDMQIWGMRPAGFLLTNLLIYLATCLVAWWTSRKVLRALGAEAETAMRAALAAAAIFALHPAHAESVAWISGRKDLLSGLFGLLFLGLHVHAWSGNPARSHVAQLLAFGAFFLALLSKITVAPLLLLAWFIALNLVMHQHNVMREEKRQRLKMAALECLFAALALWLAWFQIRTGLAAQIVQADLSPFPGLEEQALSRAAFILAGLAKITLVPYSPQLIYDTYRLMPGFIAYAVSLLLVACAVGALMLAAGKRLPRSPLVLAGSFCALAWVLLAVPYLQFRVFMTWSMVSDRFTFLMAWPPALFLGLFLARLSTWQMGVVVTALGLVLGATSHLRAREWSVPANMQLASFRAAPAYPPAAYEAVNQYYVRHEPPARSLAALGRLEEPWRSVYTHLIWFSHYWEFNPDRHGIRQHLLALAREVRSLPLRVRTNDVAVWNLRRALETDVTLAFRLAVPQYPEDMELLYEQALWYLHLGYPAMARPLLDRVSLDPIFMYTNGTGVMAAMEKAAQASPARGAHH